MASTGLERKMLVQVLALMRNPEAGEKRRKAFVMIACVLTASILVATFVLAAYSIIGPRIGIVVAALAGFGLGAASYMGESIRRWPVFSKHLQVASMEKRLNELQT